jgi:OOP family OmpA-OmpF porin
LKDPNRILVDAYGSFKPIADNGTVEGLKKNRRVELKLMP